MTGPEGASGWTAGSFIRPKEAPALVKDKAIVRLFCVCVWIKGEWIKVAVL